jgi:hypothetical protein
MSLDCGESYYHGSNSSPSVMNEKGLFAYAIDCGDIGLGRGQCGYLVLYEHPQRRI